MQEKTSYSLKESSIVFLISLVLMFSASVFMSNLIQTIANSTGALATEVARYSWINYISMFLSSLVFFLSYICLNLFTKKSFLIASKVKSKINLKIVLVVSIFAIVSVFACVNATGLFNYLFGYRVATTLKINGFGEFLLYVLLLGLLPAVFEELVFRGVIYSGLRQKTNVIVSILLSAVMFALVHFSIYKTFYQLILGIILGLLVNCTGTIVYGIIFHFINNFVIILFSYLSPTRAFCEFASWGVWEVVLTLIIFVVGIIVAVLFFKLLYAHCKKHKNYYGLEPTSKPLSNFYSQNNASQQDYNQRLLNSSSNVDIALLMIGLFFAIVIWSFNSFGGFL